VDKLRMMLEDLGIQAKIKVKGSKLYLRIDKRHSRRDARDIARLVILNQWDGRFKIR